MISLFGTMLGALSPWLLLGIPCVLGFLIYVFRKRGTSNKTIVSSLFLLQTLPRKETGRRAFVPPLQFWLELCAATLLILAAAGLFTQKAGRHIAVVIDSSLSMGALFDASSSRLDQVKRIAATDISRARSSAAFSVFSASTDLAPSSGRGISARDALSALHDIKQSFSADDLQSQIVPLANDPSYDAVWVYTDHESPSRAPLDKVVITSLPIDRAAQTNVWIRSLRVRTDTRGDTLLVALGANFPENRDASITARCSTTSSAQALSLPARKSGVSAGSGAVVSFPLESSSWSRCDVTVSLDGGGDRHPLDDRAWITNQTERPTISVIGSLSPETLGLTKIALYTFHAAPQSDGTPPTTGAPTIYHRTIPPLTPDAATLSIAPPEGALPWGGAVAPRARGGEVTKWDDSHPLLAYVNPTLLTLADLRPLVCPPSARALLSSSAGSLLCAGEDHGSRYVLTAFELFPFDGAKSPTLSILTLNIFKWLFSPPSIVPNSGGLPSRLALAPSITTARYLEPKELSLEIGNDHAIRPLNPGVLALTGKDGREELLALNAIDERESDIAAPSAISLPEQRPQARPASTARTTSSLTSLLALLALMVLGIDLARRAVRRARWSDA